jgi:hypothetical protein
VNLIRPQLLGVPAARLVATTAFGSTTGDGLEAARDSGLAVRVLNPAHGSVHPKLYLARHGERVVAALGSADPAAIDWSPERVPARAEVLDPDLLSMIVTVVTADPRVRTLADGQPNTVREVTPDGIWVETARPARRASRRRWSRPG